jgi:DNA-binding NtrC family response regulator
MTAPNPNPPVLIVDDEPSLLTSVSMVLRTSGVHDVATLSDSRLVLPFLQDHAVTVLVVDLTMPHLTGQQVLEEVTADHPDVPVIVMTATNDIETAVQCMQAGAIDYLVKPVERNRLVSSVKRALELRALRAEVLLLKDSLLTATPSRQPEAFVEVVTQHAGMQAIFRYLEAIAASPQPVLVAGESGTGKELIARALHRLSGRSGSLVAVNVAGLDDQMFSDTLFGHVRGSFTGADRLREGMVASAAEGTLFLDEIGDLPLLINAFVKKAAATLKKPPPAVPPALLQLLKSHAFPGNLRELEAMVFDAVAMNQGAELSLHSFREAMTGRLDDDASLEAAASALAPSPWLDAETLPTLQQAEERLIAEALRRTDGNQSVAAGLLGISRQALNKRLARQRHSDADDD